MRSLYEFPYGSAAAALAMNLNTYETLAERTSADSARMIATEANLFDTLALTYLLNSQELSCQELENVYVNFADKVYEEAKNVREFDDSAKIISSTIYIHKKYDLLRTILWINIAGVEDKCKDINSVVYLYEYNTDDLNKKAKQSVFAKILNDLKDEKGNSFILIPIAVDNNIYSLENFIDSKDIKEFPVVIIDDEHYIYNLTRVEELEKHLK